MQLKKYGNPLFTPIDAPATAELPHHLFACLSKNQRVMQMGWDSISRNYNRPRHQVYNSGETQNIHTRGCVGVHCFKIFRRIRHAFSPFMHPRYTKVI